MPFDELSKYIFEDIIQYLFYSECVCSMERNIIVLFLIANQ